MHKNIISPPAMSKSKAPGASFSPFIRANNYLEDVLKTPSPKANDGINLNTHERATP